MEPKMMTAEAAMKVWNKIDSIELDNLHPASHDRLFLSEFAKALRVELRNLGINSRMVGVQVPNYSLASCIDVAVPNVTPEYDFRTIRNLSEEEQQKYFAARQALDNTRHKACRKMSQIILRLFPECDDRSDMMTDYFDARFSCY